MLVAQKPQLPMNISSHEDESISYNYGKKRCCHNLSWLDLIFNVNYIYTYWPNFQHFTHIRLFSIALDRLLKIHETISLHMVSIYFRLVSAYIAQPKLEGI